MGEQALADQHPVERRPHRHDVVGQRKAFARSRIECHQQHDSGTQFRHGRIAVAWRSLPTNRWPDTLSTSTVIGSVGSVTERTVPMPTAGLRVGRTRAGRRHARGCGGESPAPRRRRRGDGEDEDGEGDRERVGHGTSVDQPIGYRTQLSCRGAYPGRMSTEPQLVTAVAAAQPRRAVIDQAWRAIGPGVEVLSSRDGGPLRRTVKRILDPLVLRLRVQPAVLRARARHPTPPRRCAT